MSSTKPLPERLQLTEGEEQSLRVILKLVGPIAAVKHLNRKYGPVLDNDEDTAHLTSLCFRGSTLVFHDGSYFPDTDVHMQTYCCTELLKQLI